MNVISNRVRHPFHIVEESPWPFIVALSAFRLVRRIVFWFHLNLIRLFLISLLGVGVGAYQWWRDVEREGRYLGNHTLATEFGLRWGIILFIVSEVWLFVSFFWAFFHRRLSPNIEIGRLWPPQGVKVFNAGGIPLINTVILLRSGATVRWAHYSLVLGDDEDLQEGLIHSIILGWFFIVIQFYEYFEAPFTISDSIFGSVFYMATGFHGLHVLVGSYFLYITLERTFLGIFRQKHHFGFEAAIWYWHFVDVVWLFLFLRIYVWGGWGY